MNSRPGLELSVRVSAFAFSRRLFTCCLTVDISTRKIILEVEYCIKYDPLNVKIFQRNSLFHPEMILRPLFCFKVRKNTGLLIFNSLKQTK